MTYNILNYQDDNQREADYIDILTEIEPNILIIQEILGNEGFLNFKEDVLDVLNPNQWSGANFTNQSAQQDIALYYFHDMFTLVESNVVETAQSSGTRDVIEWVLMHNSSEVEFNIYGAHFKASSGNSNAQQRLEEATILRNHLNQLAESSFFILAGDLNIYSNSSESEPCFEMLTGSQDNNNGQLFDPINRIGHWHNNSSFADVHTQSPRTSSFGGGANGGMDDRFDWLLVSSQFLDESSILKYIENSYVTYGNDGNHFNDAINSGSNSAVSNDIADALHDASDHLPVYMDLWFDDLIYSMEGIVISEVMPNPASVSDSYGEWFELYNSGDTTINLSNWLIKSGENEEHIISGDVSPFIDPDQYLVFGKNDNISINGGLVIDYQYSNISFSNNNDELLIINQNGEIVDEVHYTNDWPFGSGIAMEIHDPESDNGISSNWFSSTLTYGNGDNGSPGTFHNGSLNTKQNTIPNSFFLSSPFPNPFNPKITFKFSVPEKDRISIEIFDSNGRLVHTMIKEVFSPGEHIMSWNAFDQSSGVFFIKFKYQNQLSVKKVILIK
jgi:endonuclease/exonuclease/phosphatase family metal-dependent hydrolase